MLCTVQTTLMSSRPKWRDLTVHLIEMTEPYSLTWPKINKVCLMDIKRFKERGS